MKTVKQMAEAVGYSTAGIRRAIWEGRIKAEKVGWSYVIGDKEFERFSGYVKAKQSHGA